MESREIKLQELGRRLVEREILCCVSGLVDTLAKGYGEQQGDIGELCEQAFELCQAQPDYAEAIAQNDFKAVEVAEGGEWTYVPDDYQGAPSRDDDSLPGLWDDKAEVERKCCELERIDADYYRPEVYEHWAITPWLRRKLGERGETVGDLDALDVWGRCCTGQAIALDNVIQGLAAELWGDELPPAPLPLSPTA